LLDMYQYLINLADEMVEPLLHQLTFLPVSEIAKILDENSSKPDSNHAKLILAKELLSYVAGSYAKAEAVCNYSKYFSLDFAELVTRR
jgi:tyrosyl-tRNA synthetase